MFKLFRKWKSKRKKIKRKRHHIEKHAELFGEAEKVKRIESLCEVGKWSAENLRDKPVDKDVLEYERAVYEDCKQSALKLTRELKDTAYRDTALCSIIDLCMEGTEVDGAKTLLNMIEVSKIRGKIITSYPVLGANDKCS